MHVYCKKCAKSFRLFDLDMSGTLANINLKGIVCGQYHCLDFENKIELHQSITVASSILHVILKSIYYY